MSKSHPGKSDSYNHKCMVFKRRTQDREMRIKAQEWFVQKTSLCPKKYRAQITRIKKQMLDGQTPTLPIKLKNLSSDKT